MTTPMSRVQSLIPQLTTADRAKLRILLGSFPGSAPANSNAARQHTNDWLLTGMVSELGRRGLFYAPRQTTVESIRKLSANYEGDSFAIREQLHAALKRSVPDCRSAHLTALGREAARALADYRVAAPLSLRWMVTNVGKTFEALDTSFPGYVASGMLSLLVRTHNGDRS